MDLETIKEKIRLAKEAVRDEDQPIKTAAFQVIFSELLKSDIKIETSINSSKQTNKTKSEQISSASDIGKKKLAEKCDITVAQLNDVLYFENELIKVIVPLPIANPHKQVIAAKCILTAYDIVYDKTWVQSSVLSECLRSSKIDLSRDLAANLKKYDEQSFRTAGVKKAAKYKITEHGKKHAFKIIKQLTESEGT